MPIYEISGSHLVDVYDIAGGNIDTAYDLNGNVVFDGEIPSQRDYDNYTIETLFNYPISNTQGFAVHDGIIAQVREGSGLQIIDIATQSLIKTVSMNMGHGNSCQFSDEFYATGDDLPLFYIRNEGVWVYRIVGTSSTLVKKYSFPTDIIGTYVAGFGIDSVNRKFYTASYTQGDYISKTGLLRICKWDMDDVTDNGDGTFTMKLISSNDITWFDRFEAVQGSCFHDGYLFIGSGYGTNTKENVVMVDTSTLEIAHVVWMGTTGETEGCAWFHDDYMIVGQRINTYTYRKVTFGTV